MLDFLLNILWTLTTSNLELKEFPVRPVVSTGRKHLPLKRLHHVNSRRFDTVKLSHIAEIL